MFDYEVVVGSADFENVLGFFLEDMSLEERELESDAQNLRIRIRDEEGEFESVRDFKLFLLTEMRRCERALLDRPNFTVERAPCF